jgi:hypothetical protein
MHVPRCSRCVFGGAGLPAPERMHPSYAFVVSHASASVASVFAAANAAAQQQALPGISAYCAACRQVTWLTRTDDLQCGLLQLRADRARWVGLNAVLGDPEPPGA